MFKDIKLKYLVTVIVVEFLSTLLFTGCASSVKKADFSSDASAASEIAKTQADYNSGVQSDEDVLDSADFSQALSYLNNAKKELADGANQSKVFDSLGYARGYLSRAKEISEARRPGVANLLKSRRAAIDAGARDLPGTKEEFTKVDDKFQANADVLSIGKDVEDFNQLQPKYLALEYDAIKFKNLNQASEYIEKAKEEGGEKRAPISFAKAQQSLSNAENVIAADRHNQSAIAPAASKAKEDAKLALDATELTKEKDIGESVALELIRSRATSQQLDQNLKTSEANNKETEGELAQAETEKETLAKDKALNEAIENARKEFSPTEAEAFIQDGKLVIRMKQVNFPVAKADLPATSLPAFAKVKDVINELKSHDVIVEGHTDSTGSEAFNKKLSEKRANAVATYFKEDLHDAKIDAVGYGDEKPIANNKTAAGRAQNRRVDVIITPGLNSGPSTEEESL